MDLVDGEYRANDAWTVPPSNLYPEYPPFDSFGTFVLPAPERWHLPAPYDRRESGSLTHGLKQNESSLRPPDRDRSGSRHTQIECERKLTIPATKTSHKMNRG